MNVLHVLYQSYPNISGSSTRSFNLIKSQIDLGINVTVITSPFQMGSSNLKHDVIDGITYIRTGYWGSQNYKIGEPGLFKRFSKIFFFLYFLVILIKVVRANNIDVVHSHGNFFSGYCGLFAARIFRLPFVYEVRSDWISNSNFKASKTLKRILSLIESRLLVSSDYLIVISRGLYDACSSYNRKLSIVGNAINPGDVLKRGYPLSRFNFGYIGSVIELEGLHYVIEAFSKLPHLTLYIAGGGAELASLKLFTKSLCAKNIVFLGFIEGEKVREFYNNIDVIINYRRSEPVAHSVTPLKPLEGMANRKLVVVSDVGGMKELVVDGFNGIVVPSDSVDCLIKILNRLSDDSYDINSIIDNATQFLIEKRNWSANAQIYKDVYSKLVSKEI